MVGKFKYRLKELGIQHQQAILRMQQATSDMHAIDGAIQEVNYWISKLESEANENKSKAEGDS